MSQVFGENISWIWFASHSPTAHRGLKCTQKSHKMVFCLLTIFRATQNGRSAEVFSNFSQHMWYVLHKHQNFSSNRYTQNLQNSKSNFDPGSLPICLFNASNIDTLVYMCISATSKARMSITNELFWEKIHSSYLLSVCKNRWNQETCENCAFRFEWSHI